MHCSARMLLSPGRRRRAGRWRARRRRA